MPLPEEALDAVWRETVRARRVGLTASTGFWRLAAAASFVAALSTATLYEINLDGAILQGLAKNGSSDHETPGTKDVVAKLKSIHAVIGTVKGPADAALALVQKTDKRLSAAGWQRVTRISDATSTISVLMHTVNDTVDGLVVLIFDSKDKELVFANLAGEIDVSQLGAIGERFNVPGLDQVPGAR